MYDMRAFVGQSGDFVDGDQDFLTVALQLPSLPPNQFPCYQISELKPTMCLTYGHVHGKTKHLHGHQNKFLVNCKRTHANHIAILIYWAVRTGNTEARHRLVTGRVVAFRILAEECGIRRRYRCTVTGRFIKYRIFPHGSSALHCGYP